MSKRLSALPLLVTCAVAAAAGSLADATVFWTAESAEQLKAICVARDPDTAGQTTAAWEDWRSKNDASLKELSALRTQLQTRWRTNALDTSSKVPFEERILELTAPDMMRAVSAVQQFQTFAKINDSSARERCAQARSAWQSPGSREELKRDVDRVRTEVQRVVEGMK